MSHTGIRHAGHDIRMHGIPISLRQHTSAVIAHLLYIDSFIGRSRIPVIYPEERTDPHLFSRLYKRLHTLRRNICDLSRSQFPVMIISKVQISKILKRYTVGVLFLSDHDRRPSVPVSCRIDTVLCHDQQT